MAKIENLGKGLELWNESVVFEKKYKNDSSRTTSNINYMADELSNADDLNANQYPHRDTAYKMIPWGSDNQFPQELLKLIIDNPSVPGILAFKKLICINSNISYFRYILQEQGGKKVKAEDESLESELDDYFKLLQVNDYLETSALNFFYFANNFIEVIRDNQNKKTVSIKALDASLCRISKDKTKVLVFKNNYDLTKKIWAREIPLYAQSAKQKVFCIHQKDKIPGSPIYGIPTWVGATNWIRFVNNIPVYKLKLIQNGFGAKFHIQYPADYFEEVYSEEYTNPQTNKPYTAQDRAKKEIELKERLTKFLSGPRNAGKTFITAFQKDEMGKKLDGWEINPIQDMTEYKAFLEDLNASNSQILAAFNFFGSISGIVTEGKLSSGSEARNHFNILNLLLEPTRRKILEPLEMIKSLDFPALKDVNLKIKYTELATTDLVKSGMMQQGNNQQNNGQQNAN